MSSLAIRCSPGRSFPFWNNLREVEAEVLVGKLQGEFVIWLTVSFFTLSSWLMHRSNFPMICYSILISTFSSIRRRNRTSCSVVTCLNFERKIFQIWHLHMYVNWPSVIEQFSMKCLVFNLNIYYIALAKKCHQYASPSN